MDREILENYNPLDPRTAGEEYLLSKFSTSPRFKGWTIFEQPHINSMKPDFILLHPEKGIIILEVKDWNLSSKVYQNGGYINGTNGKKFIKNPINQVENYKNTILKTELTNSVYLSEKFNDSFFACIETVVYFHKASKVEAYEFCGKSDSHTKIWTRCEFDYICNINNKLNSSNHTYALSLNNSKLNDNGLLTNLVEELKHTLRYSDYNYERKEPIKLTYEQDKLAKLQKDSIRRWSGVAGAGKSLALAQKAVNALKENNRVLILTFNITLRHYLRDLCSQQFGRESYEGERKKLRSNLTICHFHNFLKIIMIEHEMEIIHVEKDDNFTQKWINKINEYTKNNSIKNHLKYDYILIDEGQDFQGEWIRFIKQFFTNVGEIFIVYDKAQDLYQRGIWIEDSDQIRDIGFRGQPGNLKISMRLPSKIVYLLKDIRSQFNIEAEEIKPNINEQQSFIEITNWINYSAINKAEKLKQIENQVELLKNINSLEDITILTTNENTGVEIVKIFESKGIKTSHVYDMKKQKNYNKRKSEKWKFQGGTGRLKICSYHSYKGWETPNIILVLDSPTTEYIEEDIYQGKYEPKNIFDAIFIGMSRIKRSSLTGGFSFTCINYLAEYNEIELLFN